MNELVVRGLIGHRMNNKTVFVIVWGYSSYSFISCSFIFNLSSLLSGVVDWSFKAKSVSVILAILFHERGHNGTFFFLSFQTTIERKSNFDNCPRH